MGRTLNLIIVLLLIAWILGMIFSAVFGLLIHILLFFAAIAIGVRIYFWFKRKRAPVHRDPPVDRSSL